MIACEPVDDDGLSRPSPQLDCGAFSADVPFTDNAVDGGGCDSTGRRTAILGGATDSMGPATRLPPERSRQLAPP